MFFNFQGKSRETPHGAFLVRLLKVFFHPQRALLSFFFLSSFFLFLCLSISLSWLFFMRERKRGGLLWLFVGCQKCFWTEGRGLLYLSKNCVVFSFLFFPFIKYFYFLANVERESPKKMEKKGRKRRGWGRLPHFGWPLFLLVCAFIL